MSLRAKLVALPVPKITRFVAVLAIAMAAGHLVQSLADRKMPTPALAEAEIVPSHIVQLSSGGETELLAPHADPEPHLLAVEKSATPPVCPVDLALQGAAAAMIKVSLTAPCRASERVVLRQAGLAITGKLGPDGKLSISLPALSAGGAVAVLFADGSRVSGAVAVPEATAMRRFGIQWQGADAFALHALENGADFDQSGDISHNNRGDAVLNVAGYLTVLGDMDVENPLLAEIYTYPAKTAKDVQIVVEAAVLKQTCGHDLLAEVLTSAAGQVTATDLTLAMPDCSAVGDFLVLKNLASDMKIAAK